MGPARLLRLVVVLVCSLWQRTGADHHYFHNYPHHSNFTTERAQYALERAVLKDFYFKTKEYLQARNLSYGQVELTGIPEEFGGFQSLEDLDLSFNLLHGSIPSSLGNVSPLRRLFLSSNRINGTVPSTFAGLPALERLGLELNVGMCSDTTAPHPPEHTAILPGTIYPRTCPISKGPPNALQDDMAPRGFEVGVYDPNNNRHPLDRGIDHETYCGPHADPQPVPCVLESLVPASVRSKPNLTITWAYPSTGTLAVRDGVPSLTEQTRYERREHREAGYPFEWLPLKTNGVPDELASVAGLDGWVNMWNDNQRPAGYRIT